ncbi:hypothetical protein GCM10007416_12720 [Kroppenstedtia guangzhouensis]|uniref:Uncharacterized protein n=1 Tax=Kroppenstedtia guangzhouensis TaxID=1274356 RepID=A0ABQ1GCW9_9BACL|nr:hypothetical protein GCM10007416_12720 [Kroppenstedtia guangzhouensis]
MSKKRPLPGVFVLIAGWWVSLATEPAYGIMKQLLNKWDPCGYYLFRARMVGNRVRQEGNTDEGKLGKE